MKKIKRLSNAMIILIVVAAVVAVTILVTALIAPRIKKNGSIASGFFVALFKDPPSTDGNSEIIVNQSEYTGAITLTLNTKSSYSQLKIRICLIDVAAYDSAKDVKVLKYTDGGIEKEESFVFTFADVKSGAQITSADSLGIGS